MNAHKVLGVAVGAAAADIRAAYKRRARETHPDMGGDAERFIEVCKAYHALRGDRQYVHYKDFTFSMFSGMSPVRMADKAAKIDMSEWVACEYCLGLGESALGRCPVCNGVGRVRP
jgi:DnaJ-class molecular chaperone